MAQQNNDYSINNKNIKPQEIISVPISLSKSIQGKYFVGQTDNLIVGNGLNAWAGLVNPRNSNVNLYANVFTISNFSDSYLTAEIWLNTNSPQKWSISNNVSPSNTVYNPLPKNKVDLLYVQSTTEVPQTGVNVYKRIVPPNTTLVSEEDGKFIESPGGNYVLVIKSSSTQLINIIVAFGWWEQLRCR